MASTTAFHVLCFLYFLTHIPVTIFVDSQAAMPRSFYPTWATDVLDGFIADFGDPLMRDRPIWFISMVCVELLLQLPFFFVACYAYITRGNWLRIPAIVYGAHVSTTMIPILGHLLEYAGQAESPAEANTRYALVGIYLPYLVVPLLLALFMCLTPQPFGIKSPTNTNGKKKKNM